MAAPAASLARWTHFEYFNDQRACFQCELEQAAVVVAALSALQSNQHRQPNSIGRQSPTLQLDCARSDDVLYDLGSGVGKWVLYCALRNRCASATGIEVGVKRHATAERACANLGALLENKPLPTLPRATASSRPTTSTSRLRARLEGAIQAQAPQNIVVSPSGSRSATFAAVLGDITDAIYKDATVVTLCNIMFGGLINGRVMQNLVTKCPSVRLVASIVQLNHPQLQLKGTALVPCTWSSGGVSWHLYRVLPPISTSKPTWRAAARPPPAVRWVRPKLIEARPPLSQLMHRPWTTHSDGQRRRPPQPQPALRLLTSNRDVKQEPRERFALMVRATEQRPASQR